MKRIIIAAFLAFFSLQSGAQFSPGQVLKASDLNAELAKKTNNSSASITGGTINGTQIGNSVPAAGTFSSVATGNANITGGSADNMTSVKAETLATKLVGYPTQPGTKWQSQYHANWNVVQSQVPYNPTEWQVYPNAANGIAQVISGTNQVVRVSGSAFDSSWVGLPYFYWEGNGYKVASVTDADHMSVQTTGGGAVSWGSTKNGTFYFVATTVTATVNVSGTAVTYVSGQPFIPFFSQLYINGAPYSATFNSPTSMTLSTSAGTLTNATLVQYGNIANELTNLRLQGLSGANEENFVITFAPKGTTLQHSYAGAGKYRPIWIGSGEHPIGTMNPHIGIHPSDTLGDAGWLTLGGDNGNQAVWVGQNASNVNYLQLNGHSTGNTPSIAGRGSDPSVGVNIDTQGANTVTFSSHSYSNTEFQVFGVGGSSWLGVGSSASALPAITANGAATDIGIKLIPKGAGQVETPAQIKSTVSIGTAPFVVASTTQVANLNASQLAGASWDAPPTIGSTTAGVGLFSAIGVGNSSTSGYGLTVGGNRSSNNGIGIGSGGTLQSAVTSNYAGFSTFGLGTAAASFTLNNLRHYDATQSTFGAGSTVGSQFGFVAEATLTGATNNFGFYGDIASGSNRWNFYANGTANNAFKGNTRFGGTTAPVATVDVTGSIAHSQQEIDLSYTYNTPTTGQTVTIASGTQTAIINPAGTLAALTITLPACNSGYDGSLVRYASEQVITALTVNASSGSVAGAPTNLAIGAGNAYICRGANTTWYRLY